MKRIISITFSILIGTMFGATFGIIGPAQAVATDCRTVTSHLVNRPDNGHGIPANWALDTMTRTVEVCHVEQPTPELKANGVVPIETWTYSATLKDEGTFVTIAGPTRSPNAGAALVGGVQGSVTGKAAFKLFTAPHDWAYWNGPALDGKTFEGSAPSSTNDWIKNLWTDGFSGTGIVVYSWTYKTCVEQWSDSSDNDDGTSDAAGDILGQSCPSAVPSTSAAPIANLPVTGSTTVHIAIVGGATALFGVLLLVIRRRRDNLKFEA